MGDVSRSAGIGLINSLKNFVPKSSSTGRKGQTLRIDQNVIDQFAAAKSTNERLAILQSNPQLAEQYLKNNVPEKRFQAPIEALVTAQKSAVALLADARKGIQSPTAEGQVQRFETFVNRNRPFGAISTGKKKSEEAFDSSLRARDFDARRANVRRVFEGLFKTVNLVPGPDAPERFLLRRRLDASFAFGPDNPEDAGIKLVRNPISMRSKPFSAKPSRSRHRSARNRRDTQRTFAKGEPVKTDSIGSSATIAAPIFSRERISRDQPPTVARRSTNCRPTSSYSAIAGDGPNNWPPSRTSKNAAGN